MDNNKNNIHLISSKEDVEDDITYTCKITFIDKSFEIIENKEKRESLALNAYEKFLKYHTWKARAEKILEFISTSR